MNNINAILTGSVINLSINGKLEKKVCSSVEDAKTIFKMILKTRENPTDESVKKLYALLNDTTRIATIAGLEIDFVDGNTYLEGFNTPVPQTICDMIQEYYENDFPYASIINFWKLLMVNPDVRVRDTLFDFLTKYNFVLTENGYFMTYKYVLDFVEPKKSVDKVVLAIEDELTKLVKEKYIQVKTVWKKAAKNFGVYHKDKKYFVAEISKFKDDATTIGLLSDLYLSMVTPEVTPNVEVIVEEPTKTYTDRYTKKMRINLGVPVKQERKKCDGNPATECSNGLHTGHLQYIQKFSRTGDTVLCCLVNPAHVIAVPKYDNTKLRACEYFPLSVVENINSLTPNTQQSFFESDYIAYEKEELEKMVELVKNNQLPIEVAATSKPETRSMDELLKIIESRLVDIK